MKVIWFGLVLATMAAQAQVLSGWEKDKPDSNLSVNHQDWQLLLDQYLVGDAAGQSYFQYDQVTPVDRQKLAQYIDYLEAQNPLTLVANEQKAYWFNLYNAATVAVILKDYPLDSIRDLGGLFRRGPWHLDLVTINGQALSLDDIEHKIVRPKYGDHRVHYAFNCAALGCPNLASQAFTGKELEAQLEQAAVTFVNHPRGVQFDDGKLVLSRIFDWYLEDFVGDESQLPEYLAQYAKPKLAAKLKHYEGSIRYQYDWALNQPPKR